MNDLLFESDNRMFVGSGPFTDIDLASFPPDYFVIHGTDEQMQICFDNTFVRLESDNVTLTVLDAWPSRAPAVQRTLIQRLLRQN